MEDVEGDERKPRVVAAFVGMLRGGGVTWRRRRRLSLESSYRRASALVRCLGTCTHRGGHHDAAVGVEGASGRRRRSSGCDVGMGSGDDAANGDGCSHNLVTEEGERERDATEQEEEDEVGPQRQSLGRGGAVWAEITAAMACACFVLGIRVREEEDEVGLGWIGQMGLGGRPRARAHPRRATDRWDPPVGVVFPARKPPRVTPPDPRAPVSPPTPRRLLPCHPQLSKRVTIKPRPPSLISPCSLSITRPRCRNFSPSLATRRRRPELAADRTAKLAVNPKLVAGQHRADVLGVAFVLAEAHHRRHRPRLVEPHLLCFFPKPVERRSSRAATPSRHRCHLLQLRPEPLPPFTRRANLGIVTSV
ncbi:hypothetical protein BRADI_2g30271v3 [Brachypodium distachyon]|uniref:Uncharacterized protein n=1 Tax=Brachypodium distachyon TaxID=15368 RepID=A0A2K2DB47_BRADI|nr:hypothetical protein BRADI_2g30271v3 [Brachypodium distachyon]